MNIPRRFVETAVAAALTLFMATTAAAGTVTLFSTGSPDGKIATASHPSSSSSVETETADDFILGQNALVTGATFTGLLPSGAGLSTITDVEIELYHVFPVDSTTPPDTNVPTRTNSPSDNNFGPSFDFGSCTSNCSAAVLSSTFTAANSVVNGINKSPGQTTGGEGPVTGEEVQFTVTFATPIAVSASDHDFFRPEVGLSSGTFLWLSAPRPITGGTGPFTGDLQAWIRNSNLDPDWLRVGTDIIGGATPPTYNMAFSLVGTPTPEPSSLALLGIGLLGCGLAAIWRFSRLRRKSSSTCC